MKSYYLILMICILSIEMFAQEPNFRLQYRPGDPGYQVISSDDLRKLDIQGATMDTIQTRLSALEDRVKHIEDKLDDKVMPTIYGMDFFKWLFGALIAAIIGVEVNGRKRTRRPHTAT